MLLFRRLFNFEKTKVAQMEQRLNHRYTPGAAFPLQARLQFGDEVLPCKVLNLSGTGAAVRVPGANPITKDRLGRLTLTLAQHRLEITASVAHVHSQASAIDCGLALVFSDFADQKAYWQLLQPIAIGQSLRAIPDDRVIQNEPQFIKHIYRGDGDAVLTVWLAMTVGTPLHSFEFQLQDYFCRATMTTGVLEAYQLIDADSRSTKFTTPIQDTTGELQIEIRQLFRWIVPNLSPAIPDDIRAFLQHFAAPSG